MMKDGRGEKLKSSLPNREISFTLARSNVSHDEGNSTTISLRLHLCVHHPREFLSPHDCRKSVGLKGFDMARPLLSRKKDLFYMFFFCMGLPSMFSM